ncbi:MAG TPA: AMP-binding protein [Baekduia sp.]|jgi:amino acid adenylation domain-containing protein
MTVPGSTLTAGPQGLAWLERILGDDEDAVAGGRVAVLAADGSALSRTQLAARVGGLAEALWHRGVRAGDRVAIALDRSPELIVGMLASLAVGAAYVVIDPRYPEQRRRFMLADSAPAVVLAPGDGPDVLAPADWPATGAVPPLAPPAERLAYLAYTSGTTGTPKGVAVTFGALSAYLDWCLATLPCTGDGVPLFASAAFDHAVTCIYPPLVRGEPLKLLPEVGSGEALGRELLVRAPYSYVKATPSHLRFLDAAERARLGTGAGLIMLGGEAADAATIRALRTDAPALRVLNHYGPTEATVGCVCFEVPSGWEEDPVPIGEPMAHVTARIEDGELWVGGRCLAAGYWTDGVPRQEGGFVTDRDGVRWYRTGDRVERAGDAGLVFAGRGDRQVKRLGHRIDLSEVEAALSTVPSIASAVALQPVRGGALAAVVTPSHGPGEAELRAAVGAQLVAAAVPARIVRAAALPFDAHGKLDRPAVEALLAAAVAAAAPPPGEVGVVERLAGLWKGALAIDDVREDDDFFDLGGDSLAAVEVVEGVAEELGLEVELSLLFTCPTFGAFARSVAALAAEPR